MNLNSKIKKKLQEREELEKRIIPKLYKERQIDIDNMKITIRDYYND